MFFFLVFSSNVSHNITHRTLEFNAPLPPPHYIKIWDYINKDTKSIQKEILNFDWPLEHK